jgi:uncharacterized protein (UPF0332 family)
MSLTQWLQFGWLVEHHSSKREIADLLAVADRDLKDCRNDSVSDDWRLAIAYNAALQLAAAALAAAGFRAARDSHHYRVIQSLEYTIGASSQIIGQLDQFRKKRNLSDYERAGAVSAGEVKTMIALAGGLRHQVENWIREQHPEFL